jgi:DNA-binding MarR family transcriptional regulator
MVKHLRDIIPNKKVLRVLIILFNENQPIFISDLLKHFQVSREGARCMLERLRKNGCLRREVLSKRKIRDRTAYFLTKKARKKYFYLRDNPKKEKVVEKIVKKETKESKREEVVGFA